MGVVYQGKCLCTGMLYVGKTVFSLEKRIQQHIYSASPRATCLIDRAIHKHGPQWFLWTTLFESNSEEELLHWERILIAVKGSKTPRGYNATDGGQGTSGYFRSEETLARMSAVQMGKKHSAETRAKMSAAHTGLKPSPEAVAKAAAANRGKKRSPAICAKMSITHRGRKHTPETRAKMSEDRKGKRLSPEHRAALRVAALKRWKQQKFSALYRKLAKAGNGAGPTPGIGGERVYSPRL